MTDQAKVEAALKALAQSASLEKTITLPVDITLDAEEWVAIYMASQLQRLPPGLIISHALQDCDGTTRIGATVEKLFSAARMLRNN